MGDLVKNFSATLPATWFLTFRTMNHDTDHSAELEARLNRALAGLPDVRVPSNFTARVLQAVELEEALAARRKRRWNWRALLPRVAVATAAIVIAGVVVQQHEVNTQRTALAKSVAFVASSPMPSVEALKNFDVIQRINQPQHADEELLALLQ